MGLVRKIKKLYYHGRIKSLSGQVISITKQIDATQKQINDAWSESARLMNLSYADKAEELNQTNKMYAHKRFELTNEISRLQEMYSQM